MAGADALPGIISIHALREEGDIDYTRLAPDMQYFYPRPPRGGRPKMELSRNQFNKFLSTPSARRATIGVVRCSPAYILSIHALREEGDFFPLALYVNFTNFYPRPPRGGRLVIL